MSSIKLILFIFLGLILASCSTAPDKVAPGNTDSSKQVQHNESTYSVSSDQKLLYRKAITALAENRLDEAEELLEDFRQQKPRLAGPLTNLGLIYYKKGKLNKSEKMLLAALKNNNKQAQAYNLLGQIAFKKGNAAQAKQYYQQALGNDEDYANAHFNIALLYDIFYQDVEKAVQHYRRYMNLTHQEDKQTGNWLEQLENSLNKG